MIVKKINKSFLGLNFIPLTLNHQVDIEKVYSRYPPSLSGYIFPNLIGWSYEYTYLWQKIRDDLIIISALIDEESQRHLIQPIGNFTKEDQRVLLDSIRQLDYPCKILEVSSHFINQYPEFCSHFTIINNRNNADYLYKTTDLALLVGRQYEKKRNLIAQAEEKYQWRVKPLTDNCKPYCCKILLELSASAHPIKTREIEIELQALELMMSHFSQLDLKGNLLFIDDLPAAFSIYSKMDSNTAVVLFEKAKREFKGLYQLINRETAKTIMQEGFEYINREQDLGLSGLRQAKSSYHPTKLLASHTLTFSH